jgi:hypothetical protein
MGLSAAITAVVLAPALLAASPASYVTARQQPDGGFAELGGKSSLELTAWAVLGLVAAGEKPGLETELYLARAHARDVSDLELKILALDALDADTDRYRLRVEPDGRIGTLVNSTIWGVLALRAAGRQVPRATVTFLLREQRPSGGWSWYPRGAPDSNDTAAAIQALHAAGVRGKAIRRGLAYLRRAQRKDGGFALVRGRASDSQSTAWAIQAFVAAGEKPPRAAFRFLGRMRRADGSYRYSTRYAVTPLWVTAQVLPALMRKPFPLR